ncbi:sodium:proton exchanger [Saccharomonospora piscinae]|uniref:sodium:proton exchanger n=1 Tax=Saccharomonospora piscinae TaxID=687388 RepID=UPI0015938264|nr:sodium:proton exchanger [Saccharomonospora piscinae]
MVRVPDHPDHLPPYLPIAGLVTVPGLYIGAADYLGLAAPALAAPLAALVYGIAIVGAAFILSWAAEAAQVDINGGLALALLAFLAVLPEYAVDFVFTMNAGQINAEQGHCMAQADGANPCSLALANMTGANRILVGVGWPLVVLVATIAVLRARRRGGGQSASTHLGWVKLPRRMSVEVFFLGAATVYSLHFPLRDSLTLVDAAVLVSLFVAYAWRLSKAPVEEPELTGTSGWIGSRPKSARRWLYGGMFAFAAVVILATAEHFAHNLVDTGTDLGIDHFLLVQWVAPLASESPELIVACLFAWKLHASSSLGTLISSKVNQWTLLVGTIPIVFAISSGSFDGLPIDLHQRFELMITAAQSLFAVSILVSLTMTARWATTLLVLFLIQFVTSIVLPTETDRIIIAVLSAIYVLLSLVLLTRRFRDARRVVRDGLATPFDVLQRADEQEAVRLTRE